MAPALLLTLFLAACGRNSDKDVRAPGARTEDMSWGPVRLMLSVEPAAVRYNQDTMLVLDVKHPSEVNVEFPQLEDRLVGFRIGGSYDEEPSQAGGQTSFRRHLRLTPIVAEEHRISPFAVHWEDHGISPPRKGWFPTRPVDLAVEKPAAGGRIELRLKPRWIAPSFRAVSLWVLGLLSAAAIGFAIWRLVRRMHREAILRRMSPRERALRELSELLARDLIARNQAKEFYIELTMIVRRYIERRHGIRAPEQTTEEFLAAVRDDPRFQREVVARLRAFLQAADLVKFAAQRPAHGSGERAAQTAQDYIETDSAGEPDGREPRSKPKAG